VLVCAAAALTAGSDRAQAQAWHTEASVSAQATLTDNANYGAGGDKESDLILNIFPAIRFNREGGRLRMDGTAAVNMIGYVQGSQTSRIFPQVSILAELEAIERIFFIEGAVIANQELLNPFLPRSDSSSTSNKYTYGQVRVAPYFKGNFGPNLRYLLRSDNSYTFTTQTDAPLSNAYSGNHVGEVIRSAEPIGWSLRVQSEVTKYQDQVQPNQTLDTALARVTFAASEQLLVGARGGYERTNYTFSETSGAIYGADIEWSPSPVTRLAGYWEHRFFGPNYQFDVSHRGPSLASSFVFSRQLATYPQLLLQVPQTGNVAGLLDAILISRFPDPVERSRQVQDLIARQGLPQSIPGAVNIYSENPNVVTSGSANFALTGIRNTLALGLFYGKTEDLPDARLPPTFLAFNNNTQRGATITFSHRLSAQSTLNAITRWQETRGIDANSGDYTNQAVALLQLTQELTLRSNAFVGLRYQVSASNVGFDDNEAALLVGLTHRF
jgi:uncharacterized protein (PEP-CTERM system associated)